MDLGVIASLEMRYRRMQMERALENMELDVRTIYKVDVLVAMRYFKKAWSKITGSIIQNCWIHTDLICSQ